MCDKVGGSNACDNDGSRRNEQRGRREKTFVQQVIDRHKATGTGMPSLSIAEDAFRSQHHVRSSTAGGRRER